MESESEKFRFRSISFYSVAKFSGIRSNFWWYIIQPFWGEAVK
jgi:hypothetical protein